MLLFQLIVAIVVLAVMANATVNVNEQENANTASTVPQQRGFTAADAISNFKRLHDEQISKLRSVINGNLKGFKPEELKLDPHHMDPTQRKAEELKVDPNRMDSTQAKPQTLPFDPKFKSDWLSNLSPVLHKGDKFMEELKSKHQASLSSAALNANDAAAGKTAMAQPPIVPAAFENVFKHLRSDQQKVGPARSENNKDTADAARKSWENAMQAAQQQRQSEKTGTADKQTQTVAPDAVAKNIHEMILNTINLQKQQALTQGQVHPKK